MELCGMGFKNVLNGAERSGFSLPEIIMKFL